MSEEQLKPDDISPEEEENLRKTAYRRNGFKIHTGIFFLINILLWVIWILVFRNKEGDVDFKTLIQGDKFFTAILFVTIVWLIFFIGHYLIVYKWNKTATEKVLKRLKKQRKKQLKKIEALRLEIQKAEEEHKQLTENLQNQPAADSVSRPSDNNMEA